MLQALYNSLSGLFAFSSSLDTISNNVSNMNTPGFRGSDPHFENMLDGLGTRISGTGLRTGEGQIEQTGNPSDLAIRGEGLFILKNVATGETFYTRAGQFIFDPNGYLVDSITSYRVQGLDAGGNLADISIAAARSLPAQATTALTFSGNLSAQDTAPTTTSVTIYDAAGTAHAYSVKFTNNTTTTPGSWLVSVTDSAGQSAGSGEIRFNTDGSLQAGYNSMTLSLTLNGKTQSIACSFGTPGTPSGTTQFSGVATSISGVPKDGHGVIGLSSISFDDKGVLTLTYSDKETRQGSRIALASFPDETALKLAQDRLYRSPPDQKSQVGGAGDGSFGQLAGGSLEMSNVDLTQELAQMIVVQRGYQASSRVMTISNEMLQQLYDAGRSGG
jgi:flagellar hook protein FlgE